MFFFFDQSEKNEKIILVDSNDACPQISRPQTQTRAPKKLAPLPLVPSPNISWLRIRVVENSSGAPVPGVTFRTPMSSGLIVAATTNSEGIAEWRDVQPATYRSECQVGGIRADQILEFLGEGESPLGSAESAQEREASSHIPPSQWPSGLVVGCVEERQVKTGDTLASLAKEAGMTPNEFAFFNWGIWTPPGNSAKIAGSCWLHKDR
jgi:hypothetical protein